MPKISDSKYLIMMEQDEAPHLSKEEIQKRADSTPPHLRDARRKGIPSMGAGAIYPVPESEIVYEPFEIPHYWPRAAAMDVGWNRTAGLWGAIDRNSDVRYIYSEYYRSEAEPSVHAAAMRSRGEWIPIAIDPAARGRGQKDGSQLFQDYIDLGLDLIPADNAVEAGIHRVWEWLSTGKLKICKTLQNFWMEYRLYRRDEKGKVVKVNDHLMDDLRYLVMTGFDHARIKPKRRRDIIPAERNPHTGY